MPLDNAEEYRNHIPAAVREAAERADALARESGAVGVPPLEDEPIEAVAESEPAAAPAVEPPTPEIDYEQRYRTLQGKYDAEIPELQARVRQLQNVLASMEMPAAPAPSSPVTTNTVVSPEDIETFGEDLTVAARRWARAEIQPELDSMRQELAELRGGHREIKSETAVSRIEARFNADPELGDKWRALNSDPEFMAWLRHVDPFAGEPRQDLLNRAVDKGDAERCMNFFKVYLAEHTAVSQPSPTPLPQTTSPPAGQAGGRPSLEDLAAPGRATGAGPASGAPDGKRVWTRSAVTRFYDDVRRNRYAGRDAEMHRTEAEIIAAASEGRIT